MFLILIIGAIFIPAKNIVLPRKNIEEIRHVRDYSGLYLKIDGEYAFYKKIGKGVFVRKTFKDSLIFAKDTSKDVPEFRFDLDGDGEFEIVRFLKGNLIIKKTRKTIETYTGVKSFIFYDINGDKSLDLLYVDTSNVLNIFQNKYRIKKSAMVYSPERFTVNYVNSKRTYSITVYPYILQPLIPTGGWQRAFINFNETTIPLEKGKTVNLYNIENPINSITYENDTLKLEISLSRGESYAIYIKSKNRKKQVAEGSLPQGVYRFKYFIGTLTKGKHTIIITIGNRTFMRRIDVQ